MKNYSYFIFLLFASQIHVWSQQISLIPERDTYINSGEPNKSFGQENLLQIKHSPSKAADRVAWIKFSISAVNKQYTQVLLKLYKKGGDAGNITLQSANTGFGENNTWNNPPITTGPITYGGTTTNNIMYFDVTKYVNTEIQAGSSSVAFQLSTLSAIVNPMKFASRESTITSERPKLEFHNETSKDITRFQYQTGKIDYYKSAGEFESKEVDLIAKVFSSSDLNMYGGWLGAKSNATGYFRNEKDCNGAWHLIDPLGNLFYSTGLNSVEQGGGVDLPSALKKIGVNTMGSWSDETIKNIPYCPRLNLLIFFNRTIPLYGDMYDTNLLAVFEPGFKEFCEKETAKELLKYKNDSWVMGYFTDNELPFYKGQLNLSLSQPAFSSTNAFKEADAWMKKKYGSRYTINQITEADEIVYEGYVAERYYKITSEAIRKADPNHMIIGSRLHGYSKYREPTIVAAGKYMDVISINFYGPYEPSEADMLMWEEKGKKPFIITEFYTKEDNAIFTNDSGAGHLVKTQEDRAKWFENFTLKLLRNKANVGYHWFRYIDHYETNKGLYSKEHQRYEPLATSFTNINKNIYALRSHILYGSSNYNGAIDANARFCVNSSLNAKQAISKSTDYSISNNPILYPNPSNGFIHILLPTGSTQLTVYSMEGKKVLSKPLSQNASETEINIPTAGFYILQIHTASGESITEKLIIQ